MPPRHAYWTIILEGKPTAFRAHTRDELAPTLRQLQARHSDAVLMWFARGRLWESPEQEREASSRREGGDRRGPGWRPGGSHQDQRERFRIPRDEKRRRFAERARRDRNNPLDRPAPWNRDRAERRPPGPRPERPRERRDERPPNGQRRPYNDPNRPKGGRSDEDSGGPREPRGRPGDRPFRDRPSGGERPRGEDRRPVGDRPPGPGGSDRGKSGPQGGSRPFRPPGSRGPSSSRGERRGGWRKPGGGGGRRGGGGGGRPR